MIYLIIFLLLLILTYQYDFRKKIKNKWFWYYTVLLALISLAGFRYHLGVDTWRYERSFALIPKLSQLNMDDLSLGVEPLFLLMESICKSIISEFWFVQLVQAILVDCVIFHFFRKYTSNVFCAITLYFLMSYVGLHMETMRAACAISMMLLGYEKYRDGSIFKCIGFFVTAFFFHYSSIILVIVFIYLVMFDGKIKIGNWLWGFICIVLLLSPLIIKFIQNHLAFFAVTDIMLDKLEGHAMNSFFDTKLNWKGMLKTFFTTLAVPIMCLFSNRNFFQRGIAREQSVNKNNYPHEAIIIFAVICTVLSMPIFAFYRYAEFFRPFIILTLADSFGLQSLYLTKNINLRIRSYNKKILIIIFPALLALFLSWNSEIDPYSKLKIYWKYNPYSSIFNPIDYAERDAVMMNYDAY